jgi:hypothetical protein
MLANTRAGDDGIQAAKDVKLSSITRPLNESIPLIKTEDRLSRNLDDEDFTAEINNQICRPARAKVLEDMVMAHRRDLPHPLEV